MLERLLLAWRLPEQKLREDGAARAAADTAGAGGCAHCGECAAGKLEHERKDLHSFRRYERAVLPPW